MLVSRKKLEGAIVSREKAKIVETGVVILDMTLKRDMKFIRLEFKKIKRKRKKS